MLVKSVAQQMITGCFINFFMLAVITQRWFLHFFFIYISPLIPVFRPQAVQLLRPGGVLVYCTCTLTIAENEGNVAWALENFPSLTLVEQVCTEENLFSTVFYLFCS